MCPEAQAWAFCLLPMCAFQGSCVMESNFPVSPLICSKSSFICHQLRLVCQLHIMINQEQEVRRASPFIGGNESHKPTKWTEMEPFGGSVGKKPAEPPPGPPCIPPASHRAACNHMHEVLPLSEWALPGYRIGVNKGRFFLIGDRLSSPGY